MEFLVQQALEDESEKVRDAAAQGLGIRRTAQSSRRLISKANDTNVPVPIRLAAISALGWVTTPEGRGVLLGLLTDDDETNELRVSAARALAKFDDEETPARLEDAVLNSSTRETRAAAGLAFYLSGMQRQDALASGREAAKLAPENGSYQASLGWYAYEAGELAESIEASREAVRINPDVPMAFFNLGLALLVTGDAEAASKGIRFGPRCLRAVVARRGVCKSRRCAERS